MDPDWNDSQPIYRQLRDRVVAMILDRVLKEGDPLPSVRTVAAEYRVNPLTVLKGYQQLVDEKLVETSRGLGMFINDGARNLLLQGERQKFLEEEWPRVSATIQRLGLTPEELLDERQRVRPEAEPTESSRGGALKPWHASKHAAFARSLARPSHSTHRSARRRGSHSRTHRSERRRQNHRPQRHSRPHSLRGISESLGRDPWTERDQLMLDVCFIADVAVLPRWIRVSQALEYVAGVHPRFDRAKAEAFLAKTTIRSRPQGQGIVEGHGDATAPRSGHGH